MRHLKLKRLVWVGLASVLWAIPSLARAETPTLVPETITLRTTQTVEVILPRDSVDLAALIHLLFEQYGDLLIIKQDSSSGGTIIEAPAPMDAVDVGSAVGDVPSASVERPTTTTVEPTIPAAADGLASDTGTTDAPAVSDPVAVTGEPVETNSVRQDPPPEAGPPLAESSTPTSSATSADTSSSSVVTVQASATTAPRTPPGAILINEVLFDPATGSKEWVELYNPYNTLIPLANWHLEDNSGKHVPLPSQTLGFDQYIVVEMPTSILNNSGDSVMLFAADGTRIDAMSYGATTGVKKTESLGFDDDVWKKTLAPSPGFANAFPPPPEPVTIVTATVTPTPPSTATAEATTTSATPTTSAATTSSVNAATTPPASYSAQSPRTIRFVELYPNTLGQDETEEYIRLENTGTESVDLHGWSIADASGRTWMMEQALSLAASASRTFFRTETNIVLNNDQETLRLFAPDQAEIDTVSYADAPKGSSYRKERDTWRWKSLENATEAPIVSLVSVPTSASAPKTTATSRSKTKTVWHTMNIETARKVTSGVRVIIEGVVDAIPGTFSRQTMYIADENTGLQIYSQKGEFPPLSLGNRVRIQGTMGDNRGDKRLRIASAEYITTLAEDEAVAPTPIPLAAITRGLAGSLVTVEGTVESARTGDLTLVDGETKLTVRLQPGWNITEETTRSGARIRLTGIISIVDTSIRLSPRGEEDVSLLIPAPTMETASTTWTPQMTIGMSLFALCIGLGAFWYVRSRHSESLALTHSLS